MNNKTAWRAMLAEAQAQGLPMAYQSDMWVDYHILAQLPEGTPFGWILREYGTHWTSLHEFPGSWGDVTTCYYSQGQNGALYYFWNGQELRQVPPADLRAIILQDYNARFARIREERAIDWQGAQGWERARKDAEAEVTQAHNALTGKMQFPDCPQGYNPWAS